MLANDAGENVSTISADQAIAFARLALRGIAKEYPNKLDHVITRSEDVRSPKSLHPAFYGCFDWHSSVHGHWMLIRLLKAFPALPIASEIRAALRANLTAANLKAETDYLSHPSHKTFERTYGWAWLLKLAEVLHGWNDPDGKGWSDSLRPLAEAFVQRYLDFLPKQTYPIRTGVHPNTAFGLMFAHDYARTTGHEQLRKLIEQRARDYFGKDVDAPASWEPSGADFFSAVLMEADLMRRVLPANEFPAWFQAFLPGVARNEPKSLLVPALVTDRSDPLLVHLDGLNLSRAWAMRGIVSALPAEDPARKPLLDSAGLHANAGLQHVTSGDYAGEHWLASFAIYLMLGS